MLASGTKLLGASTPTVLVVTGTALVLGVAVWAWVRTRHGEAPFVWQQRRKWAEPASGASTTETTTV